MVVFTLGSDSGFGLGADGIVDDYDDESGISVILWCIIFVFLLIVTIWFYITQLMPARNVKCEPDDEDEDERVANRLFDQLAAKNLSKNYKESSSCEPSTSSEDTNNYEVIDGEIRIHYSTYERQTETHSNENGPKEASTIVRRPSMEEMSLIFPGFLPSISEEDEEQLDEGVEEKSTEKQPEDVYESNANNFIGTRNSTENNSSFDPNEQREKQFTSYNGSAARVVANRKGKQPATNCSTELRRRTSPKDLNDTQNDKTTSKKPSITRDIDKKTAVSRDDCDANELSHESHNTTLPHETQNMKSSKTACISGSENYDPQDQNIGCNMRGPDPLIIARKETVTQEKLKSDANENIGGLNELTDNTRTISSLAKSNFIVKNDNDEDLVCLEKSSVLSQEVDVLEEEDRKGNTEKVRSPDRNGLILSHSAVTKCPTKMTKQLTHAWTFYAMSEHTNHISENLEGVNHSDNYDQHSEIPKIVVDFYKDDKCSNFMDESVEHLSLSRMDETNDSFETDIDVDDVDLDELDMNDSTEGDLNCFFKRHVSVTDLDKILSSSENINDGTEGFRDEKSMEMDLEDIDDGITAPVGKANNQINIEKDVENKNTATTGGQNALDQAKSNNVMTRKFVLQQNFIDQVSDNSECVISGKELNIDDDLRPKIIKSETTILLTSTPQDSRCTTGKTSEDEQDLENFSKRDIEGSIVNKKKLEQVNHVENLINNNANVIDNEFKLEDNGCPSESKKIMEIESQNYVKTGIADHIVQEDQRSVTSRVDNSSNISAADMNIFNVKNIKEDKRTFIPNIDLDNAKQNSRGEIKKHIVDKNISPTDKSLQKDPPMERKIGLTAEELSGRIDLSRPISSSSKGEIIIGRRKLKSDSASKSITNVTSRKNEMENRAVAIDTDENFKLSAVTQSTETKEPDINRETSKIKRVGLTESRKLYPKEKIAMEKSATLPKRSVQHEADLLSKSHIEKRALQPTIEKSVVLIPEKSQLQTSITIKDIPDTNIGVKVSTNSRLDLTRPIKTSTGLEKAEQIVASRLRRLEGEKKNVIFDSTEEDKEAVQEDVSCAVSNSREINWSEFLVDGDLLEKVDTCKNERMKYTDSDDDVILLSPIQTPKPVIQENTPQIEESYILETLSSREIDWKWFEEKWEDPMEKRASLNDTEDEINKSVSIVKDNYPDEQDMENSEGRFQEDSCNKIKNTQEKTTTGDTNSEQNIVLVTESFTAKNKSGVDEKQSTGDKVNELNSATEKSQEEIYLEDDVFINDNDNLSQASYPSSEPEFPVRLTKSFSELRTVESLSHVRDSKFRDIRPDRSKSQTDVFDQDDVFTESGEQVFKTRITVDEVYANKRRIVILNVRKKSVGKTTRCRSLSDLESTSSRKHVVRIKSVSSHPKERSQTVGDVRAALKAEENNQETMFGVSGSFQDPHDNEATSKISPSLTFKKTVDQNRRETKGDIASMSCGTDNKVKHFPLTTVEQSSTKGDVSRKVNAFVKRSYSDIESHDKKTDSAVHPTTELQSYAIQGRPTCTNEKNVADEHDNCASTERVFALSRHSPTPLMDAPTQSLPRQISLSPVEDLTEQKSTSLLQRRSSGAIFAVSRHSPTPLAEFPVEKPMPRQACSSPVQDATKEVSVPSSGTIFALRRHSPTPLGESLARKPTPRQESLSPVEDLTKDRSSSVPSSGTMFAVSRHSPTPLGETLAEKPTPRQESLSPVEDLTKNRSSSVPSSGTMFAVSRHSPSLINSPVNETVVSKTLTSREIDWQWLEDNICKENKHTAILDPIVDKSLSEKITPVDNRAVPRRSYVLELLGWDTNPVADTECKERDAKQLPVETSPTESFGQQNSSPRSTYATTASVSATSRRISPTLSSSLKQKRDEERALQRQSSLSPVVNQESNSRRSSASSGSIFAAIRVSPTPSMESESSKSNKRSTRGSYRSGTVFAVSGYSSAASDTESQRPDSTSPIETEPKRLVISTIKDSVEVIQETKKSDGEKRKVSPTIPTSESQISPSSSRDGQEKQTSSKSFARTISDTENQYRLTTDGWLENAMEVETSSKDEKSIRKVMVTDLDTLLKESTSPIMQDTANTVDEAPTVSFEEEKTSHRTIKIKSIGSTVTNNWQKSSPTEIVSSGVQETDLDAIFFEKTSRQEKREETLQSRTTNSVKVEINQRSKIRVTSSTILAPLVQKQTQDTLVVKSSRSDESPVFDDLDDEVFINTLTKPIPRGSSYSSDADSETSSLNSVPLKPKSRHTRASLEANREPVTPPRLSQSTNSSSATPITAEQDDPELNFFFPPKSTSTPENYKTVDLAYPTFREAAKEPEPNVRHVNAEGTILLKDSSYGATQPKTRSQSESRTISTEIQRSAFTPVRSNTDRRSISQEYILEGIQTAEPKSSPKKTLNPNSSLEVPTFKEMADSHKSMPDLHNVREESEVDTKPPTSVPYHSRLSAHTRLWLSQTAGIDTSDLCKDESGGSEIFLFPSNRFQPGKNVDASFLSIASETEDIPDDVSTRPSSPMSEFSFSGETPFGGEFKDELNIISCGHNYCGKEEVLRGQEKTSFTSCPSCFTYYCSRECRQAHWKEHKKSCYFGRINSYMRSFIYFCHKKENLKLLLSKIATNNYPSKGRGCVMVTFASPKQARKFMTSGCVLLPSPPSYSPLKNLMREGVVSKHKVNLVQQVKDYDPRREFVLNLAVVAGRLEDLPRYPVPRHKLNTVLQCIKIPLSDSLIEQPKPKVPDTSQETRVFYLPKCSRHEFINDMEARRHYCRIISKGLKQYGVRLKKDYPEAYSSLCLYVEKNLPFKPLTVYGNQDSKIIACRIMPEGSSSAV